MSKNNMLRWWKYARVNKGLLIGGRDEILLLRLLKMIKIVILQILPKCNFNVYFKL